MKRYTFRLHAVARIRKIEEEVSKARLAAANHEVQDAIAVVESRIDSYQQSLARADSATTGVDSFMHKRFFDDLAGKAITEARDHQHVAERLAERQRSVWSAAAMKVKALDRLDERRRGEYQIELDRHGLREVDDIVIGQTHQLHGRSAEKNES